MASPYHNTRARRIFIRAGVTLAAADRISRHHIRLDKLVEFIFRLEKRLELF